MKPSGGGRGGVTWWQVLGVYLGGLTALVGAVWWVSGATVTLDPAVIPERVVGQRPAQVWPGNTVECTPGPGLAVSEQAHRQARARAVMNDQAVRKRYTAAESASCGSVYDSHHRVAGGLMGIGMLAALVAGLAGRGRGPRFGLVDHQQPVPDPAPQLPDGRPWPTCARCGRRRVPKKARPGPFGIAPKRWCAACALDEAVRAGFMLVALWTALAVVAGVAVAGGFGTGAWVLLVLGLGLLGTTVQAVPHELGHALAGWIVRLRVVSIAFGRGPVARSVRIGATDVSLGAAPAGGRTLAFWTTPAFARARIWAFAAGGPLATAAVLVLAFVWAPGEGGTIVAAVRWAVVGSAAFILVGNLVPFMSRSLDGPVPSDGLQLLTLWRRARITEHDVMLARVAVALGTPRDEGAAWLTDDDRVALDAAAADGSPGARAMLVHVALAEQRWADAAAGARVLQAETLVSTPAYGSLRHAVAAGALMTGPVLAGGEADVASAEAYDLSPFTTAARGLRGAVLVELGRLDEGLSLLRSALHHDPNPRNRSHYLCQVAIGEATAGRDTAARTALADAVALDPGCNGLDRARARLDRPLDQQVLPANQPGAAPVAAAVPPVG
jgi:hypothetical protein